MGVYCLELSQSSPENVIQTGRTFQLTCSGHFQCLKRRPDLGLNFYKPAYHDHYRQVYNNYNNQAYNNYDYEANNNYNYEAYNNYNYEAYNNYDYEAYNNYNQETYNSLYHDPEAPSNYHHQLRVHPRTKHCRA